MKWTMARKGWEWTAPGGWTITRHVRHEDNRTEFVLDRNNEVIDIRSTVGRARLAAEDEQRRLATAIAEHDRITNAVLRGKYSPSSTDIVGWYFSERDGDILCPGCAQRQFPGEDVGGTGEAKPIFHGEDALDSNNQPVRCDGCGEGLIEK